MGLPLDGIRVIDWTHVLAGPACAYYLGQLGAEVIKVERPGRGDAIRHRSGTDTTRAATGMSTAYLTQSAGKQALAVDLATDAGRALFERLLRSADVLVENHRPATLERLNLTERETRAIHPRLIHCAITGYGRDNDMADAPAYNVNIQAISGLMAQTGTTETGPLRTGAPIVDYVTALTAALGILSALMARTQSGEGAFVDFSMLETAFAMMSSTITDYRLTGTEPKPRGNAANSRSPSAGTFNCKEGYLSLGVNEEAQFQALAVAIGQADWLTDHRFAIPTSRQKHRDALGDELGAVLATRSAQDWEKTLLNAGVPCALLRTLPQALDLPPASQRHYATRGPAGYTGLPFVMTGAQTDKDQNAPKALGADTLTVLKALGYAEDEIGTMREAGVIGLPG